MIIRIIEESPVVAYHTLVRFSIGLESDPRIFCTIRDVHVGENKKIVGEHHASWTTKFEWMNSSSSSCSSCSSCSYRCRSLRYLCHHFVFSTDEPTRRVCSWGDCSAHMRFIAWFRSRHKHVYIKRLSICARSTSVDMVMNGHHVTLDQRDEWMWYVYEMNFIMTRSGCPSFICKGSSCARELIRSFRNRKCSDRAGVCVCSQIIYYDIDLYR